MLPAEVLADPDMIISGRRVQAYAVLERICNGLGIPREMMGLSYPGSAVVKELVVGDDENVRRRNLLLHGIATLAGETFLKGVGDWVDVMATPRLRQISHHDVAQLQALISHFRDHGRQFGGTAILDAMQVIILQGPELMENASSDTIRAELAVTLATLAKFCVWEANDAKLDDVARAHCASALDYADQSGNRVIVGDVLRVCGRVEAHRGDPDYALKFSQLAEVAVGDRAPRLQNIIRCDQAKLLAELGASEQASRYLGQLDLDDPDVCGTSGEALLLLGDLDGAAERLGAIERTPKTARAHAIETALLAETLVRAGDSRGPELAMAAATLVGDLPGSPRTADRLVPLRAAMASRGIIVSDRN